MKSRKEFKEIYLRAIKPKLVRFERARNKMRRQIFLLAIASFVANIYVVHFVLGITEALFSILPAFLVSVTFGSYKYWAFRREFKNKLIAKVFELAFPDFTYRPNGVDEVGDSGGALEVLKDFTNSKIGNLSQMAEFNRTSLFLSESNTFRYEDEISGKLGKTDVCVSEVFAKRVTGSGKNRRVENIFSGLFFKLDFHKNFSQHTVIRPDFAERFLGGLIGNKLQKMGSSFSNLKLVRMEDPRFEKLFAVYSSDQNEARYLITPKLMEKFVELQKSNKGRVSCAFFEQKFYIAISSRKNRFEPSFFGSVLPFADLKDIYEVLELLQRLVEEFELNTRLWSKE